MSATATDITSLLTANASPSPSKKSKRGAIPELVDATELADKAYQAYQAYKTAEATYKAVEKKVIARAQTEYEKRAKGGVFSKSLNFDGAETDGVQVTFKDQFSAYPIEKDKDLRDRLGDTYDRYFEHERTLTVSDTSDETIKFLLETLGEDKFKEIFAIGLKVVAKKDMDRNQFDLPEDVRPGQYKAQVKPIVSKKK